VTVYAEEHDEYYSFLTPEAYAALKEWMDYRALHGEKITSESWLMRDRWRTMDVKTITTEEEGEEESAEWRREEKRGRVGLATYPKNYQLVPFERY
jgi:hypothetical protein